MSIPTLIKEATCSRLRSGSKTSLAAATKSDGTRQLKQIRQIVLKAVNAFFANANLAHRFNLRVGVFALRFSLCMKRIFKDNNISGLLEAVDMKQIDYVRPFIGLIFDNYCGEENTAPVSKAFTAYVDLLLVLRNRHDVGVSSGLLKPIQSLVRNLKNDTRQAFQDFYSMGTLKWHVLDHITKDVSQLGNLTYVAVDH